MNNIENGTQRTTDSEKLIEDFNLNEDAEFFTDPINRIEFLESLEPDDFCDLVEHVNARVRGYEPRERTTAHEEGGYLPLLGTPSAEEKPGALRAGFAEVKKYLADSDDSTEQKVKGAAMAAEALVIWVHPSNDGNGRTSRFLGKFIEDGTTDIDQLVAATTSKSNHPRSYDGAIRVDQGNTAKGLDLILDDDEIEELKKTEMPAAEGIALSIKKLLEDKSTQARVESKSERFKAQLERDKNRFTEVV